MPGMLGTGITLLVLLGVVSLAIRSMIKDKKSGKTLSCGGDCRHCKGCHQTMNIYNEPNKRSGHQAAPFGCLSSVSFSPFAHDSTKQNGHKCTDRGGDKPR